MNIKLNPADPESISFELHRAVKQSGLTHQQIVDKLVEKYRETISPSALNHNIWRGTVRLTRALRILDVCGVDVIEIE
ncbi:hypothetical protein ACFL00_02775 [Pseudomonadota bacterium]